MADVSIKYKGNTIAEMSGEGTKTLKTSGCYCESDIEVSYLPPNSGGGSAETNCRIYEITLAKGSGWVLLTTLDDEVLSHINDATLTVALVNISPYVYEYFAGDTYLVGNKPIGYTNQYPMYGYSNRESSETSAVTQPIYYPANYTGTATGIGGYGTFRVSNGKYYIQPSNGFIKAGTYRLIFTW